MVKFPGTARRWKGTCLDCGSTVYVYLSQRDKPFHCDTCTPGKGYKRNKAGHFYLVAGGGWLKGGITNFPKRRLAAHKRQGLTEVLHIWKYEDGNIPFDLERLWKEHLATLPDTDRPEKHDLKDGWTESIRRTVELEQWIEEVFKPLADDLLAAPLAA